MVATPRDQAPKTQRGSRALLHPLGGVTVRVHDERRGRVTQSLGDDAWVNARLEEQRGGGVPEIVEPDPR